MRIQDKFGIQYSVSYRRKLRREYIQLLNGGSELISYLEIINHADQVRADVVRDKLKY